MSSKKKTQKQSWSITEDGSYSLEFSKRHNESLCNVDSSLCIPFIKNEVLYGEIVKKKIKVEKISESFCIIIELHPNTMQLCGLKIGGPIVLSSSNYSLAGRVWPSSTLPLEKIALPLQCLCCPGFKVGDCIYAFNPPIISFATSIKLSPFPGESNCSDLQSLLKTTHFKRYLVFFLDKSYVVCGQIIEIIYFGKSFSLKVVDVSNQNENVFDENFKPALSFEENDSIADKLNSLCLNNAKQSDAVISSSTPLKATSINLNNNKNTNDANLGSFNEARNFFQLKFTYLLTTNTAVTIDHNESKTTFAQNNDTVSKVLFKNIGGLKEQVILLNDLIITPIKNPYRYKIVGIKPVHGVLFYGASGTGKSLLAKALAHELGGSVKTILGSQVISNVFGESENKLRAIFKEAQQLSPCVVIIDEIDSLCPRRDLTRTDAEKRLVAAFTSILDELNNESSEDHVIVVGTTNRIDAIDPALRRSGRFDREIEVTIPTVLERAEILRILLAKFSHNVSTEELQELAELCHGYVGADLLAVCKEAGLHAVREGQADGDGNLKITIKNLEYGLKQISPSAMRELTIQVPKVFWKDIGGNDLIKQKLKHTVEWPLKNPDAFVRLGIDPPRGVLLYGPPGCSKTLTAKALATESGLNFISIKGPELFSKYVGDSEKAIRKIFSKARSAAPSIVFIDELDAVAIQRGGGNSVADRVLTTLLTEMDGVEHRRDVIVLAATNRPDMIDKAFLRPGRIDRILHVPLPNSNARKEILQINFRKMPIAFDVDINKLEQKTEMFSGAEICALCREAALAALDTNINSSEITESDFDVAFQLVVPQTSKEMTHMYEEYEKTLQSRIK